MALAKLGRGCAARTMVLVRPRDSGGGGIGGLRPPFFLQKDADAKRRLWRSVVEGASDSTLCYRRRMNR
jgi:hypothetical protein